MADLNEMLMDAAWEGKVDEVAALLDQGADIDAAPPSGITPLMSSVWHKKEAAALCLIERGANVGLADESGRTALYFACWTGMEAVARELLKRGASVEAEDIGFKRPLHLAAQMGHESIVWLLVTEHGAQVDPMDSSGRTPLLLALDRGKEGVAQFLASVGADWAAVDIFQQTALHRACQGGLTSIVTRLLDEFGFDLHTRTTQGDACLYFAAKGGSVETAKLLLQRGIPADIVDDSGRSPLFEACVFGCPEVASLLLDLGADIERRDLWEWSPLSLAATRRDENGRTMVPIVITLVERGARLDVPLPHHSGFSSLDQALARKLQDGFLKTLFTKPDEPIPIYRRTLRWAFKSPEVVASVEEDGWSLVGAATTEEEAEEMRTKRLSLLRDDAWERRKHLVIDRALDWGY